MRRSVATTLLTGSSLLEGDIRRQQRYSLAQVATTLLAGSSLLEGDTQTHNLCTQSDIRPLVRGRRHQRSRMTTKWLALKRQKVKVRAHGRRHGRCETNLVNAVLISFVSMLIHTVQSPTDAWNWSRRISDGEDDAHARLHVGIRMSLCDGDGLPTATP